MIFAPREPAMRPNSGMKPHIWGSCPHQFGTAVWSVAMPRLVSMEWALAISGALLFASPWMGQFTSYSMSTWVSWICGAVGVAAGLMALAPAMEMRHATGGSSTAH